ncbi:MBL fold metallo-hydrolase [Candidatus Magnetomonas plexicatena]|uniref:MBL fold metallo-hydrolase n=1 Tax=Candidatus Magnetomonas plexicatena TaxID=2552947 RepID=UPI0011043DDF|nr:MBL fold metallo-hydrolase [Nitrospirales bacterium LBB_01]
MLIRCWGSRGSIPVSGKEYLKYGGDTTCIEIMTESGDRLIIDTGSGIRELGKKLIEENQTRFHIFFTHFHWDHIMGFPFFRPIYKEGTQIDFYGCVFTHETIEEMISKTMVSPNFPVNFNEVKAEFKYTDLCSGTFQINSMTVTPIHLSHPNQGLGYKFQENGKTFVFITDNELRYKHPGGLDYTDYVEFSKGADLLYHDSEYTEEEYPEKITWGHSIYTDSLKLALEADVKTFGLFHHNQNRTDDEIDAMVENCRTQIKSNNVSTTCFAVEKGSVVEL